MPGMKVARMKAPADLVEFQKWFGGETARPLSAEDPGRTRGREPSAVREADARLKSANGMSGFERLNVYNRQYWFRLVTILQEEYPCAVHLLGLDAFNAWAVKYVHAHPPASPYLADLDAAFPAFIGRRLRAVRGTSAPRSLRGAEWRAAVREALAYEQALSRAMDVPDDIRGDGRSAVRGAAAARPVSAGERLPAAADAAMLASSTWGRAAYVTPLWLHWDFPAYRALCRADESLSGRHPLARRGREGYGVCLHRHDGTVYEKPLSRAEFLVLDALGVPRTLDQVFRTASRRATPRDLKAMERGAGTWFREWTERGWIVGKDREGSINNYQLRMKN